MEIELGKKYSFEGRVSSHFIYPSPLIPSTVLSIIHVFEIVTDTGIIIPCVASDGLRGTLGFLYQDPGSTTDSPDWDGLIYLVNIGDRLIVEGEFGKELGVYKPTPWKQEFYVFAPKKISNTTNGLSNKVDNSVAENNSGIATAFHAVRKGNLMLAYQFISRELNLIADSILYLQKNSDKKSKYFEFMEISKSKLWELCSNIASQIADKNGFLPDIPKKPSSGIDLLIDIGLSNFLFEYICQNIIDTTKMHLQYEAKKLNGIQYVNIEHSKNLALAKLNFGDHQKRRIFLCSSLDHAVVEEAIQSPSPSRNIMYQQLGDILVSFKVKENEIEKSLDVLRANHIATTVFKPRISTLQTSPGFTDVAKSPIHNYFMRMWGEHL